MATITSSWTTWWTEFITRGPEGAARRRILPKRKPGTNASGRSRVTPNWISHLTKPPSHSSTSKGKPSTPFPCAPLKEHLICALKRLKRTNAFTPFFECPCCGAGDLEFFDARGDGSAPASGRVSAVGAKCSRVADTGSRDGRAQRL